jgi:hypothetical protein
MKVYEMAPEQKIEMKQKVLDYCDHEFSYEKMISNWDQTLCRVIAEFKLSGPLGLRTARRNS